MIVYVSSGSSGLHPLSKDVEVSRLIGQMVVIGPCGLIGPECPVTVLYLKYSLFVLCRNIPNFGAIFPNVSANITDIQQKMQVFRSQIEEQANLIKDRLVQMFADVQEPKPLSESSTSSLAEQIEALKRNLNEWSKNVMSVNTSQLVPENVQENLNEKIKQFQQVFLPLIQRIQGPFIEGIQNLQKSMAPGVQDIKKYIAELESAWKKFK